MSLRRGIHFRGGVMTKASVPGAATPPAEAVRAAEIGARIRQARHEAGMTQKELGALVGVSERSVAAWELGEGAKAPYAWMDQLERFLGISAAWLIRGSEVSSTDERLERIERELKALRSEVRKVLP
jgi:transcriptional regulator with XRE-family HTH domain